MECLLDTSVLMRLVNKGDSLHQAAADAVLDLHRQKAVVHVAPQVLIEFRSAATRPVSGNGLGIAASEAQAHTTIFEAVFRLVEETPDVYPTWREIVEVFGVVGKQVHDARLAAVCHVAGITHLMTFNERHFRRFSSYRRGLTLIDPQTI